MHVAKENCISLSTVHEESKLYRKGREPLDGRVGGTKLGRRQAFPVCGYPRESRLCGDKGRGL